MLGLSDHLGEALPRYPIDEVPSTFASTWTWADLRKGAEAMNPFAYFQYRYYEERVVVEHGLVAVTELAGRPSGAD
jgi:hypothetical protein